jgi:peptide/nickel transport system substrate-binding protein
VADPYRHAPRGLARLVAVVAAIGLALPVLAGAANAATPHRPGSSKTQKSGGNLTFGLEAETLPGYCLTKTHAAISGIQVIAAIYDTLTVPNDKGVPVPYLAKSVTPNADNTVWTITLRPGVQFSDKTPLDAAAVKLNLDSYRGAPGAPNASPDLFKIYLGFISDVSVVDPMTVKVTLNTPVPQFPAYLYSTGRLGIMAPAQLNAGDACDTKLIGTGPFTVQTYLQNEKLVAVKNPNYWQAGYPKADSISFVPVPEGAQRNTELQGGQLDIMHQSGPIQVDNLRSLGSQVKLLTQKPGVREIAHYWVIAKKAPFSSQIARTAFATAINRAEIIQIRAKGIFQQANSLSDVATPGYLKDAGYPAYNLKKAQALVQQVKAQNGGQFNIILGTTTDPDNSAEAQLMKEQLAKAGISAAIAQFDQGTLINKALSGDIDVLLWRNLYGGYTNLQDADSYVWFANINKGYVTNFGNYNDDAVQALLDQGRAAATPAQAKPIYQKFERLMAQRGYLLPTWYVDWTIGYQNNVHLTFPPLPDGTASRSSSTAASRCSACRRGDGGGPVGVTDREDADGAHSTDRTPARPAADRPDHRELLHVLADPAPAGRPHPGHHPVRGSTPARPAPG